MNLPSRYNISNLAQAIRDPTLFFAEGRRLALSANATYSQFKGLDHPCQVIEEDWDTLIILDGCRYDLFQEVNTINGHLESRTSTGSESWEFLRANFQGRNLHDTVYVTANPHAPKLDEGTFHRTVNLLDEDWDETLRTVTPEVMTERARQIHEEYPHKRLIVHYMQPHFPFIGEKGRQITHTGVSNNEDADDVDDAPHVWIGLRDGEFDIGEDFVYEAYRENLELTIPHVKRLLNNLDGKSVVTSDHGNLIGERTWPIPVKGYGHPRGFYASELVTVPWLVVKSDGRRRVMSEPPSGQDKMKDDVVDSRLADLGYK